MFYLNTDSDVLAILVFKTQIGLVNIAFVAAANKDVINENVTSPGL